MELARLGLRSSTMAVFLAGAAFLVFVAEVSAVRYLVGGNVGWSPNTNYTIWAKDKHLYKGDWLWFVYDRNQMNILEVNKTNYDTCNTDHPMTNWTRGAGRDVVPLNMTKMRYFVSGKGFCFSGMKLAVDTKNPPPPPSAAPIKAAATTDLQQSQEGVTKTYAEMAMDLATYFGQRARLELYEAFFAGKHSDWDLDKAREVFLHDFPAFVEDWLEKAGVIGPDGDVESSGRNEDAGVLKDDPQDVIVDKPMDDAKGDDSKE